MYLICTLVGFFYPLGLRNFKMPKNLMLCYNKFKYIK